MVCTSCKNSQCLKPITCDKLVTGSNRAYQGVRVGGGWLLIFGANAKEMVFRF